MPPELLRIAVAGCLRGDGGQVASEEIAPAAETGSRLRVREALAAECRGEEVFRCAARRCMKLIWFS